MGYCSLSSGSFSAWKLRISGEAFDIWEWTVGGYYQEAESQTDVVTNANVAERGGVFDIVIDIPLESEVKAIFTHNVWHITEQFNLTLGLRYTEEEKDGTGIVNGMTPLDANASRPAFVATTAGNDGVFFPRVPRSLLRQLSGLPEGAAR